MSRSYIQPLLPNRQAFSSEEQREEKSSNLREKRSNPIITSDGQAKKAEASETKKLERKSTEDINASADAFIKNFRQQLLIQRVQSIENYEQMLARGL